MYSFKLSRLLLVACLGLQVGRLQVENFPQSSNLQPFNLSSPTPWEKADAPKVANASLSATGSPPEYGFSSGVQLAMFNTIQPSNLPFRNAYGEQAATPKTCPADVETLTALLIRDLPSYANRVIQRSRNLHRTVDNFSYVLVAGNPEFEPLTLGPGQYTSAASTADLAPPQQVFLTTLERAYRGGRALESQHYHWLFLTQTPDGWRLVMMFSRIGSSSQGRPPTPPRESSNGVIGQAVSTWLRDCRAGTIRSS